MKDFKWQEDNWAYVELEEGVAVDVNFWTDDMSGKRYLTFYPTFIGRDCTVPVSYTHLTLPTICSV